MSRASEAAQRLTGYEAGYADGVVAGRQKGEATLMEAVELLRGLVDREWTMAQEWIKSHDEARAFLDRQKEENRG